MVVIEDALEDLKERLPRRIERFLPFVIFTALLVVQLVALYILAWRMSAGESERLAGAVAAVLGPEKLQAYTKTLGAPAWRLMLDPLLLTIVVFSAGTLTATILVPIRTSSKRYSQMIADIAHDLKTPLTAIDGYLETLQTQRGHLSAAAQDHCISTVLRSTRSLTKLVNDLLDFTKLDAIDAALLNEPFSLLELACDTVITMKQKARERKIELDIVAPEVLPWALGNIILIERAMINCIDNALRYSPPGSKVNVELTQLGQRLAIRVADQGCGIPQDELAKVGKRYYRARHTRTSTSGSGLGLSTVRRIAELHGGKLHLHSVVDAGTTVELDVPCATPADLQRLKAHSLGG